MDDFERVGWIRSGGQGYRHHCNAKIVRSGKTWTSNTVDGHLETKHQTPLQAAEWLEQNDKLFWTRGRGATFGLYANLWINVGLLGEDDKNQVFTCTLSRKESFPAFLNPIFKRHFFTRTTCVKCSRPMTELLFSVLSAYEEGRSRKENFIVCGCGYPVWRLEKISFDTFQLAIRQAEKSLRRNQSMFTAGGNHTKKEIEEILALQSNRCLYCHKQFTDSRRPTRDHLLAIVHGGTDWALNIVLACKSCNSRRCDIPFRTFCRLLSPTQNKRILKNLRKRILALDMDHLNDDAFWSFKMGVLLHEPKHSRYGLILETSSLARQNAATNKLLPSSPIRILKREP